jgi:hypothetical protein
MKKQRVHEVYYYNEDFIETFLKRFEIHDLWNIRPMENEKKRLLSGNTKEVDKFRDFIITESHKEDPLDLIITLGIGEKNYPTIMLNQGRKYFKLYFRKSIDNDGTPLILPGSINYQRQQQQEYQKMMEAQYYAQLSGNNNQQQAPAINLNEVNKYMASCVAESTRQVREELEEVQASREQEYQNRIKELEKRIKGKDQY